MMDWLDLDELWGVRGRMLGIAALIVIGMLAVLVRVWYLQTRKREVLEQRARNHASAELQLRAPRGDILSRNGVELAVSTEAPSLYAHPGDLRKSAGRVARTIAPHIELDAGTIEKRLRSDAPFVWIAREIDPSAARSVLRLDLAGIHRTTEHERYYPLGTRAGQLIGFAGIDGQGLEGLERVEDDVLRGEKYSVEARRDARSRLILDSDVPNIDRLKGNTVVLTIDERIQRVAQEAVAKQVEKYDAEAGFGVVLEVGTNDVLAMATTPGFNPNNIGAYSPSDWRLRPVTDVLEPGSVFKPFVLAGALEEGTVNLGTTFDCEEGYYRVGGYGIHDTHAHDVLTAAEIIQKSSNIGIYKIARTLGKERLYEYLRGFGFGRRTGIGLPGERPGRLRPPSDWSEIGFANIAFGQGVSATPLQVAAGLSAIANDGLLMQPQVVEEVRNHRGEVVRSSEPTMRRRVVSEQTADKVTSAMAKVMTEEGTGTRAMLSGFKGAGKTGTAQQIDPKTGGYGEDNWVGSFGGFAPASSPEIVVLVMIDEPAKTHYGGVVAAPAFETIAQKALAIRGVEAGQPVEADDEEKKDTGGDDGARAGTANLLSASTSRETTSSVVLPDDGSSEKEQPSSVPDFEGMSLGAAVRKAARLGVLPRVRGWGRVVDQSPAAGEPLRQADELTLVLAPARRSGGEMEGRVQTGRSAPGGH